MTASSEVDVVIVGVGTSGDPRLRGMIYVLPTPRGIGKALGAHGRAVGKYVKPTYVEPNNSTD